MSTTDYIPSNEFKDDHKWRVGEDLERAGSGLIQLVSRYSPTKKGNEHGKYQQVIQKSGRDLNGVPLNTSQKRCRYIKQTHLVHQDY
jgi:hypothetical protein